ncbi:MAG TPA: SHOCT domain-containing protein [bacterium]|nr:SHOCT domain-containing protein [bacterium]
MNSRDITIILAVVLGVILLVPVLSMSIWGYGMMGPGMMGWGMMGGYGLLIVFLVLLGIVLLVLETVRRGSSGPDPLEILKQRLARGEVTREQYEEFKQLIQS